ncbi:hypothetical protein GCM10023081_24530 [Arthrobacter ginkgonis]|uniref:5-bromo-4-chloroindolyl phosphate hydrolysis protein n=1 Tax=Arthrobacter ginkgonis TaxID=1630594 RepID=A0ABP7CFH0_9MICC
MSRLTLGNVVKVALAVICWPFIAFLVLAIGIRRKNKKVVLEGALYAAAFSAALAATGSGALLALAATGSGALLALAATSGALLALAPLLGIGSMGISALRSYMLRDLWLHKRVREPRRGGMAQSNAPVRRAAEPSRAAAPLAPSSNDLSSALTWVTSHAKQNKHRLPTEAYVTILETCQTLDAVIDAERRQPSADARFEYELGAIAAEYLPAVLQKYLAIPPSMVDNRQPNGRTPSEELTEQLQLLSGQAEALHSGRHGHTSAELTTMGNFLRDRFGHHQRGGFDFGIE